MWEFLTPLEVGGIVGGLAMLAEKIQSTLKRKRKPSKEEIRLRILSDVHAYKYSDSEINNLRRGNRNWSLSTDEILELESCLDELLVTAEESTTEPRNPRRRAYCLTEIGKITLETLRAKK
jgi:hypothetical protein